MFVELGDRLVNLHHVRYVDKIERKVVNDIRYQIRVFQSDKSDNYVVDFYSQEERDKTYDALNLTRFLNIVLLDRTYNRDFIKFVERTYDHLNHKYELRFYEAVQKGEAQPVYVLTFYSKEECDKAYFGLDLEDPTVKGLVSDLDSKVEELQNANEKIHETNDARLKVLEELNDSVEKFEDATVEQVGQVQAALMNLGIRVSGFEKDIEVEKLARETVVGRIIEAVTKVSDDLTEAVSLRDEQDKNLHDILDSEQDRRSAIETELKSVSTGLTLKATIVHEHPASDITSGVFTIARGGTNNANYTANKVLAYDGSKIATVKPAVSIPNALPDASTAAITSFPNLGNDQMRDELGAANARYNAVAVKYNDLARKFNTLLVILKDHGLLSA